MKITKGILILIIGLLMSCNSSKKDKQKDSEEKLIETLFRKVEIQGNVKDYFEVSLNFLAEKDDNFQLFYSEDYFGDYSEEQSVSAGFLGTKKHQSLTFKLPKDIFPSRYRLDIGSNKEQKLIKIRSLTIRYDRNEIFIPENEINKYLIPNDFINYVNGFHLTPLEVEGVMTYDPYFTCSPELIKIMLDL